MNFLASYFRYLSTLLNLGRVFLFLKGSAFHATSGLFPGTSFSNQYPKFYRGWAESPEKKGNRA